jgi:hypothetical protein
MSSTRMGDAGETILARVREALRLPAPPPHLKSHALEPAPTGGLPVLPLEAARPWLPDGGDSPEESRRILGENLARLKAELHRVADAAAAAAFRLRHLPGRCRPLRQGRPRSLRRRHHRLRGACRPNGLRARLERDLRRPRPFGAATRACGGGDGRPGRAHARRRAACRPRATCRQAAEHVVLHHRPEPHRRHRADPGARGPRPEGTSRPPRRVAHQTRLRVGLNSHGTREGMQPGVPRLPPGAFCGPRSPGWKPGDSGYENHPAIHAA